MVATTETIKKVKESTSKYKYGFSTNVEVEKSPKGLNEGIIKFISSKKGEPNWLLEWRIKAYNKWLKMEKPLWANVNFPEINFQDIYYYAAPKTKKKLNSLDEVDPEILKTYEKLGIPLNEQKMLAGVVAVDAVFDSVSVATTFREKLSESGKYALKHGLRLSFHPGPFNILSSPTEKVVLNTINDLSTHGSVSIPRDRNLAKATCLTRSKKKHDQAYLTIKAIWVRRPYC